MAEVRAAGGGSSPRVRAGASVHSDPPPPLGLSVAAVAHRLGVAPATLRTWDRRYGLGPSSHVAGAHRRYAADDLGRLLVMRRLTLEGVPPADAARTALATEAHARPAPRKDPDGPRPDGPGDDRAGGAGSGGAGSGGAGSGGVGGVGVDEVVATVTHLSAVMTPERAAVRPPRGAGAPRRAPALPWGQEFDRAAVSLDPQDARRLVEQAFAGHGVLDGWEQLVDPAVRALGRRWETTGPGIDSVLELTTAVLATLRHRQAPPPRTSAVVLLAAAEDERDVLVLHVLAAALAEQGVPSRVLAPGRPREALGAAVRSTGPAAVMVVASSPVRAGAQLVVLPRLRPAGRLVLAGPGWRGVELPSGLAPQVVPELAAAADAAVRRALA